MSHVPQVGPQYCELMKTALHRVSFLTDDAAALLPPRVWRALCDVRLARESVYRQIEQLSQESSEFRGRHCDVMLSQILKAGIASSNAQMGNIQVFDQVSGRLVIQVHKGFQQPFLDFFGLLKPGEAACGAAFQLRSRVIVDDVTDSDIFRRQDSLEVLLDSGVRSVQSTPLIGSKGQMLGVFSTHNSIPRWPTDKELLSLNYFAACAATLIEWYPGTVLKDSAVNY